MKMKINADWSFPNKGQMMVKISNLASLRFETRQPQPVEIGQAVVQF